MVVWVSSAMSLLDCMLQRSAYLGSGMIWGSRLSVVGFDCSIFSIQLYILQSQLRASAALAIEDILSTGRRRKALRASSAALQSASGLHWSIRTRLVNGFFFCF